VSIVRTHFLIRIVVLLAATLNCGAPGACAQATASAPLAQISTREVVDEVGRSVRVPLAPSRIVSLAPSLTETLYALGLQDRLVGDTEYCDYPVEAQKKPKVGGTINPNL